jgi:hypothetical protein
MRQFGHHRFAPCALTFLVAFLGFAGVTRGDEFHLKDGSKIVGTIVGYEDGSFKVQTSYGFAYVRKENIAEIVPADKKTGTSPADSAHQVPADSPRQPATLKPSALSSADANTKVAPMPRPIPNYARAMSKPSGVGAKAASLAPPPIAASPSPALLPDISALLHPGEAVDPRVIPMKESVRGNVYVNQTYGFQIYKPPTWQIIPGAQNDLPNAIGALGTEDQTTLLVIGRDPLSDSLENQAAKRERTMRGVYDNYRPIENKHMTIAGLPAIEQRFYGTLADHDWSVTVATLARGNEVFTIVGMTSADSDLIQIQENVIARTIASLQFIQVQ